MHITDITEPISTEEATVENRTARLTILIDPKKKAAFEAICRDEDLTPSQVVRKLVRDYIEHRLGPDWREQVFAQE